MTPSQPLCFVDVETTGLSPKRDRVIDIGIVRVENGKIVETYQSMVNPHINVPAEILQFTGLSSHDIERAPDFDEVKPQIKQILTDSIFVAHNARFDYGFLRQEFARYGDRFRSKLLCTVKLSRLINKGLNSHSLESIIKHYQINVEARHRALPDAMATWEFYKKAMHQFGETKLSQATSQVMKRPSLPPNINPEDIAKISEGPGVYIFYDKQEHCLYVGKTINLKDSVLSHFSSYRTSSKDVKIAKNTAYIETVETAGELGSLLKQSELIGALQPLYGKKLRNSDKLLAAIKTGRQGYNCVELEQVNNIYPDKAEEILAIYKSKKAAVESLYEIAKEHTLCPKLLGIEKGDGACFNYQLGKCKGACVGEDNVLMYNLRFASAFTKTKIPSWPFPGPILVEETYEDKAQSHLIDNWCYAGSFTNEAEFDETTPTFDYNALKIIKKFIARPSPNAKIKLLNNLI